MEWRNVRVLMGGSWSRETGVVTLLRTDISRDGKIERHFVCAHGVPDDLYYTLPETRNCVRFSSLEAARNAAYGPQALER